jgi:hypothetical protein
MTKKRWWQNPDLFIGIGFFVFFLGLIKIFPKLNNYEIFVPLYLAIASVLLIASFFLKRWLVVFGFIFGYLFLVVLFLISRQLGFEFFN